MHTKNLVFLAVASLAKDAVAVNMHRHAHEHLHKKDLGFKTDYETVTDWVTVTVYNPAAATSSAQPLAQHYVAANHSKKQSRTRKYSKASSSTALATSVAVAETSTSAAVAETSTSAAPQTTLITAVKPTTQAEEASTSTSTSAEPAAVTTVPPVAQAEVASASVAPAAESSSSKVATTSAAAASVASTSDKKRGLAYNDKSLLSGFLGSDSKVSWAYGWSQTQDFASSLGIEFVPMLWGTGNDFVPTWSDNAKKAIAAGSTALLSFNEPDNAGQANLDPSTAAAAHIQYMNPFSGQARIGSPAITNSGSDGQGISWLQEFMTACAGNCAVDFVAVHWYSSDGDDFLAHLTKVYEAFNLPVWVTEFAPTGNEIDYNTWLATVTAAMDTEAAYSFVERYSYFMVAEGSLVTDGSPNQLGNTFAFSS